MCVCVCESVCHYFISCLVIPCILCYRRSWCVQCDGQLLHFMLDILIEVFTGITPDKILSYEDELRVSIEQCIYCLYNHPSKRTKAKHLEDHNTEPVSKISSVSVCVSACVSVCVCVCVIGTEVC